MGKIKIIIIILLGVIAYICYNHTTYKELFLGVLNSFRSESSESEVDIENYSMRIQENPDDIWNYIFRGSEYMKSYKYDLALNDYNKVISLANYYSSVYGDKSLALLFLGKTDDALKTINGAILKWPTRRLSFYLIKGIIYDLKSNSTEAIKFYKHYIKNRIMENGDKMDMFALKRNSVCLYKLGKYQESYSDIEIANKLNVNDKQVSKILDVVSVLKDNKSSLVSLEQDILNINIEEVISVFYD